MLDPGQDLWTVNSNKVYFWKPTSAIYCNACICINLFITMFLQVMAIFIINAELVIRIPNLMCKIVGTWWCKCYLRKWQLLNHYIALSEGSTRVSDGNELTLWGRIYFSKNKTVIGITWHGSMTWLHGVFNSPSIKKLNVHKWSSWRHTQSDWY